MRWMYKGSIGVLATDDEALILEDYFTSKKCENLEEFKHIAFSAALSMISKAKEEAKEEIKKEEIEQEVKEEVVEESPDVKRRGRPKKEE